MTEEAQQVMTLLPKEWHFIKHVDDIRDHVHLVMKSSDEQAMFSLYGFEEGDPSFAPHILPDKSNFRFKMESINYFVFFKSGFLSKSDISSSYLAIHNPSSFSPVTIELSKQNIYGEHITKEVESVWSAPHALFWVEMVIIIGTVVSLACNYFMYKSMKTVSRHSYSIANLNSSIPPSDMRST